MEMGAIMGGIYRITQLITRFSVTNLLWLLFNLPIIYICLNLLYLENKQGFLINLITLIVLLPFIFFPATTAMFAVVRHWIIKSDDSSLIKSFFTYYKSDYKTSMLGGFVFVPIWVILIGNVIFYSKSIGAVAVTIFIILSLFLITITCYFFANTVHVELPLLISLKNACFISFSNVLYSILISLTNIVVIYFTMIAFPIFIPILVGSLCAYLSFWGYYHVLLKIESQSIG